MDFIPHTADDTARMLAAIGVERFEDLLADVPADLRATARPDIADGLSEQALWERLVAMSRKNAELVCFRGAGCYDHHIPAVVPSLLSRSEFLTGYTPYQAELSQGMLTTIYEYQSHIQRLTGMEVASASMYDGASALAEAALMTQRATGRGRVLISAGVSPRYREVVATYLSGIGTELVDVPLRNGVTDRDALAALVDDRVAGVLLQNPNFLGCIEDLAGLFAATRPDAAPAPFRVVAANPIALGILAAPGDLGADIVVGEGQPLGVPMSFGGPGVGFFATRMAHVRQMPGRLVGRTLDADGNEGFCLTFQTREQHIRREKATSNICSNQALLALANTLYLSSVGPDGLRRTAARCHQRATELARRVAALPGWEMAFDGPFFHEFAVRAPLPPERVNAALLDAGMLGGADLGAFRPEWKGLMLFCATERRTPEQIDALIHVLDGLR
ncbi:MAG: aminomethyl-transferring glycine dehydrogenase subunit GcvPA [Nitrospirae bacterium]|nr:aminomethyl-transferring glycine dehydrogenase subunit GcvPA [Nitrospirota bacterium]